MSKLLGFLDEKAIVLDMKATTKEEAIRELIQLTVDKGGLSAKDQNKVYDLVIEREQRGSTGLGAGIAIPHVKDCPNLEGLTGALGRSEAGIPFDAIDGNPVHLVFLILGGAGTADDHIDILKKLAALRMNDHFIRFLRDSKDLPSLVDTIRDMSASVA
jgi:mannitol/fructose-specific phosphotransferase system IIA component (Ntr-type)